MLFVSNKGTAYVPEEGQVTATFGPYLSKTNFGDIKSGIESSYESGVGVIAVGDISSSGGLELGFFYMPRTFLREQASKLLVEATNAMHLSMGYRRWLARYFSYSLSFYSSYSMGTVRTIYKDIPLESNVATSARDVTEYGLDGSLQGDLWSNNILAIVLQGRYSLSLTNKQGEESDQYGFLIALRYFVQSEKALEKRPRF